MRHGYPWLVTEPGIYYVKDGSFVVRIHALLNELFH